MKTSQLTAKCWHSIYESVNTRGLARCLNKSVSTKMDNSFFAPEGGDQRDN